jgi:hypothetical protein
VKNSSTAEFGSGSSLFGGSPSGWLRFEDTAMSFYFEKLPRAHKPASLTT